jgi:cytochrome c-type biogenesis protein
MQGSVGFGAAFAAGVISFLSPCVLPIIPGYLSFMTGLTTGELSEERPSLSSVLLPSILFVVGFSVIFVAFGVSASLLGRFLTAYRDVLMRVAGVVVFAFGILLTGIIKVPWLYGEARIGLERSRAFGRAAALFMGMAFAAGWTPCVGPILGAILLLAASSGNASRGALLLLTYSIGLGLPFILTAVLFGRVGPLLRWLNRHALVINRVAGILLMAFGVLIFTGRLSLVAGWLTKVLPSISV